MKEITISTSEIVDSWTNIMSGGDIGHSALTRSVRSWRMGTMNYWVGVTGKEMSKRLRNGYIPPEDKTTPSFMDFGQVDVATPTLDLLEDEGELLVDQVLAGEDMPYVAWEPQEAKRGITVRISFDAAGSLESGAMADYFAWCLRVLDNIKRLGLAPTVELFITDDGSAFHENNPIMVKIPVANAGEVIDSVAWRAFLSPGGFRTLGFLTLGLANTKNGSVMDDGLGRPAFLHWTCTFEDGVLTIGAPPSFRVFNSALMNDKLRACGAI